MKGILVTTDNTLEVKDFSAPLYKSLGAAVDGPIEVVHPMGLADPFVFICNEEFLFRHKFKMNTLGCLLYGTHIHGSPILGDIVVMKTGWTSEGPDIVGLEQEECDNLMASFAEFFKKVPT